MTDVTEQSQRDPLASSDEAASWRAAGPAVPAEGPSSERARLRRPGQLVGPDLAILAGLLAVLAFLWGRGRQIWFWIDEGIAVGLASQPLAEIPASLRLDGSPPLYYFLLHGWMSLFGSSEAATHTLSLLFALAVVPAALWAGWSLFDRRTGWMCALVAALNPFIAFYANETRMYSLVTLLTLLVTTTFLHAFVFGRRRYLPAFAIVLTLLVYTHSWGLFLAVGAAAALVPCLVVGSDRRRTLVDAALAFGAVGLLYLPWVPTLLYQVAHDPNPWSRRPTLVGLRDEVTFAFGGREAVVALGVGGFAALVAILKRPSSRNALAVTAMLIMPVVVLAGGWASAVWGYRYLGVVVPPLLLVVALGLARGGNLAVTAVVLLALFNAPLGVRVPPYQKSNAQEVAQAAASELQPGDLVISPDFSQIPLLAYYLPPGLRYAGAHGAVDDVQVTDWRNSLERVRESRPAEALPPLIDALPVGGSVLMMCPDLELTPDLVEFHQLVKQYCAEIEGLLRGDDRLRLEMSIEAPDGVTLTPFDGWLFTKETSVRAAAIVRAPFG
ncbi:MAG: glycosyltransferase family 39 protein [Actinobacteria bacterium]|nr:glycosyltransferase family 39 protein [Actinomycetota bacterium]